MAKNKKDTELTLDEENEQKAKYGGVLKRDIIMADSAIAEQKHESSELSGTLSAAMNLFEKKGGRKDAMKDASKWARREPADFADWWRAFMGYGVALGIFGEDGKPAQMDMIDQQAEQQKNADSVDAATAAASKQAAQPSMGKEVTH